LAASFAVGSATARICQSIQPEKISYIITGDSKERDGDEDHSCGEYIQTMIQGTNPDQTLRASRAMTSTVGVGINQGN